MSTVGRGGRTLEPRCALRGASPLVTVQHIHACHGRATRVDDPTYGTNPKAHGRCSFGTRRGTPLTQLYSSVGVSPVPGCAASVAGCVAPAFPANDPACLPGPYTAAGCP